MDSTDFKVKIFDMFLYTTVSGWMYMLDSNYFCNGDKVTDGEKVYTINDKPVDAYIYSKSGTPGLGGESCWIYTFNEKIPDCENKILWKVKNNICVE